MSLPTSCRPASAPAKTRHLAVPIGIMTGMLAFVPYVGTFIYIAKVQGALNAYWKAKGSGSVATVPGTSTF